MKEKRRNGAALTGGSERIVSGDRGFVGKTPYGVENGVLGNDLGFGKEPRRFE